MCRKLIKETEEQYYFNLFEKSKNSSKEMWKRLGKILNPNKVKNQTLIKKLFYNGIMQTKNDNISNSINNHFCTVGPKLQQKIDGNIQGSFKDYLPPSNPDTFFLAPVIIPEILKEIEKLDPRKATGPDNIGAKVVLLCAEIFAENLEKNI